MTMRRADGTAAGRAACTQVTVVFLAALVVAPAIALAAEAEPPPPDVSKMTSDQKAKLSGREIRVLRRQMAAREEEAGAAFKNAETAFLVGEYDKAIEEFLAVAKEYDDTSFRMKAAARVGDVYYRQRKYERAVSYFQRALRTPSEPWWPEDTPEDYARADYMIGVCYYDQHNLNQAFAHFRRFVKKYPESKFVDRAYDFIGRGNMEMKRYGQSIEAFRMVGTAQLGKQSRRTVSPGEELYIRVTDADVGLATRHSTIPVRVTTTSGDDEIVDLESLGIGSPIFLGTIKTRLGTPRLTRSLDEAFSAEMGRNVDAWLATADNMEAEAKRVGEEQQKVQAEIEALQKKVEAGGAGKADDQKSLDAQNARKADLEKQVADLHAGAEGLKKRSYTTLDAAYGNVEKVLAQWGVAKIEQEQQPEEQKPEAEEQQPEAGGGVGGGGGDDEETAKKDTLSDVFTPKQIREARLAVPQSATTSENYRFRRALMEYWHEQLLNEYKTLDLTGSDTITVDYMDLHGAATDNQKRIDKLGVASDARILCLGPDLTMPVSAVILGDQVRVKVADPDMDRTNNPDTVTVTVCSIPKVAPQEQKLETAQKDGKKEGEQAKEDTMEAQSVAVFETADQKEEKPALLPEGAPSFTLALTETGPHTGEFIGTFPTLVDKEDSPVRKLGLSLERMVRNAYADERTSTHGDEGWVVATQVEIVPGSKGEEQVIDRPKQELDRRSELEKGIALGKLARVYQDLGLKVEAGRTFDEALKVVKAVADAERDSALGEEATYQMWDLYFASGNEEAAAEACSKLIATFPKSPLAPAALLIMGKAEKEPYRAIGHFSRLVSQYPDSPLAPEAQYQVAEMKARSGNLDVAAYEVCANKYPDSNFAAKSLLRLAEYYTEGRDYTRAKEYLERVTIDFPDFDELDKTTYMRGVCAYRMGDIQLSYTLMHEVIEKYPGTSVSKSAGKIVELLQKKLKK